MTLTFTAHRFITFIYHNRYNSCKEVEMRKLLIFLAILSILIVACQPAKAPETVMEKKEAPTAPQQTTAQTTSGEAKFQGKVLAGTTTPYMEFNKADYDLALKTKPYVVLYFYANWCPICKVEQPSTFAAFNELQRSDMIGFRVNYRDSDTDDDEVALAREFGVTYQHTKVVLKNGQRVLKSPESWNKQDYLDNLGKI